MSSVVGGGASLALGLIVSFLRQPWGVSMRVESKTIPQNSEGLAQAFLIGADFIGGDRRRNDFAINLRFSYAPGNKLIILRSEIND